MKWFRDKDWGFNGLRQLYRVLERHPELAHIEPSLQVFCPRALCHATWWPNYLDQRFNHRSLPNGVKPLDWRRDGFAYHFAHHQPAAFKNPKAALNGSGMFAEMGRMILEAADMVKHLR